MKIQFKKGQHFQLHGREYVIEESLEGSSFQICCIATSIKSQIKYSNLVQLLFQGELVVEVANATDSGKNNLDYNQADFTQIPLELREEAKRRYRYVSYFLELNLHQRTPASMQPIIKKVAVIINDTLPPSWLTLYRWLKTYEAAGHDIRALIPRHRCKGNYGSKLHPHIIKIIDQAIKSIYLNQLRPDIADVYDEVFCQIIHENEHRAVIGIEQLEIPHRSTIYRFISKLEPEVIVKERYGKRTAAQMYDPVLRGPRPTRPLERVEIDHTKLPLFVVDTQTRMPIGTPWLTSAIDKYSGITLGYYASFEPPSCLSVMQCLLHAICPKNYLNQKYPTIENTWDTYGLPEVVVVDNGKEFHSTHFEDACLQLGITIQYCPPKMPWYKSAIERYFGALNSQLLSDQPGKSFPDFLQKYDYDPIKNAVISFEALQEIMNIFIVDIYNQSSHPDLKSPRAKVWSKAIIEYPPALPASNQELKILIGNTITRKVSRRGVEFEGLFYNSPNLARLRLTCLKVEKATVKYDPTDLSRIYVKDQNTGQFLEVPALSQDYTQELSLWQHQVVKQYARTIADKVDIVALVLAKEKIQQIVEREWKTTKKGKTRTAMARWLRIGNEKLKEGDQESALSVQNGSLQSTPSNSFNKQKIIDKSKDYLDGIIGLSELGSALTDDSLPSFDINIEVGELEEINYNKMPNISPNPVVNTNKQIIRKQHSKSKLLNSEHDKDADGNDINLDEWKPDLSGWDVTIGLPSGL